MDLIYQFVAEIEPLWVISVAIAILILDVFILGTTALLLVAVALLLFAIAMVFINDPIILTWSLPFTLIALFLVQRALINASIFQKLPHQEKRSGTSRAVVRLAEDAGGSSDYFYGYKDDKQAVSEKQEFDQRRYKAVLPDGRSYLLPQDPKLHENQSIKISISTNETAKVIKYYE